MNTSITLKRAAELIRSADHNKVDHTHENANVEVFSNVEHGSLTVSVTSYAGKYGSEEFNYEIASAELVDGTYIKLVAVEDDEEYNVYLFNLVPVTGLTAE